MTNKEKTIKLLEKCMEYLTQRLHDHIPEQGEFPPCQVCFEYPGTKYMGYMRIEIDLLSKDGTGRRLRTSMGERDSDKIVSHYMEKGTNAQLIAWFADTGSLQKLMESYAELKKSVDNFD